MRRVFCPTRQHKIFCINWTVVAKKLYICTIFQHAITDIMKAKSEDIMKRGRNKILAILMSVLLLPFALNSNARPKVGLVLGGGGAKGAAHIGALKVIEKAGIPIDYIAGTSIGSIVGGLYALGYRADQLEELFLKQEWIDLFAGEVVEKDKIEKLFDSIICQSDSAVCQSDSLSFDKLPIPYRCVAVDIKRMEEVVLSSGKLSRAMRASMAIPVALRSVRIDGRKLVDGGVLNNLPVDVVRDMGADIVIAIDLQQEKHKTKKFSLKKEYGIGGIIDWVVSRPDWRKYNDNCADADIYINPPLGDYNVANFHPRDIKAMIEIGEKTAHKYTKKLKNYKKIYKKKR